LDGSSGLGGKASNIPLPIRYSLVVPIWATYSGVAAKMVYFGATFFNRI
jgi:hypothetical protein